jgi:hypothetical protein
MPHCRLDHIREADRLRERVRRALGGEIVGRRLPDETKELLAVGEPELAQELSRHLR